MKQKTCGLAVLAALPSPYYIPAWNHLSQLAGGRLTVCFLALNSPIRTWRVPKEQMEFEWRALGRTPSRGWAATSHAALAFLSFLLLRRPCAVICGGYDCLADWVALAWCKLFGSRLVLWSESNARDDRPDNKARRIAKRFFATQCDAAAVLGRAASDYASHLGVQHDRIFHAPFGLNRLWFAGKAQQVDPAAEKVRRGWPPRLILYSGRLVEAKGVFTLLQAFRNLHASHPDVGLVFVGHGPAQPAMEQFCRDTSLERVYFSGAQQYEDMPLFFSLAELLVLPTYSDPYGYVVVEAFACGVPAVVSRVAGVADDLIVDGETGFAVEPGDAMELALRIRQILDDDSLRARMSAHCRRKVEGYSPEACAQGLYAAATGGMPASRALFGTAGTMSQ